MTRHTGVFCVETSEWWGTFGKSSSVRPLLELLSQGTEHRFQFVHRSAATRAELTHYLEKWAQRGGRRYPILYLAFHGDPGKVYVGDQRRRGGAVTLDEIAGILGDGLRGRLVHFGSCGTLGIDRRRILRFLKSTGVVAVTGFREDVEWMKSSAFEVLIFDALLRHRLTVGGAHRMAQTLEREVPYLRRELNFRMVVRDA